MSLIAFTKNHQDLSTDLGYQFKFFCDKCGNGHMSSFMQSNIGLAGTLLRGAGSLLGGFLGSSGGLARTRSSEPSAARSTTPPSVKRSRRRGRSSDSARAAGTGCAPSNCWNAERGLCEACAPEPRRGAERRAGDGRQGAGLAEGAYHRPGLGRGHDLEGGGLLPAVRSEGAVGKQSCLECGASVSQSTECRKCGTNIEGQSKFCPECGEKVGP